MCGHLCHFCNVAFINYFPKVEDTCSKNGMSVPIMGHVLKIYTAKYGNLDVISLVKNCSGWPGVGADYIVGTGEVRCGFDAVL